MSETNEEPDTGLKAVATQASELVLVAAFAIVATGWLEILLGLEVSLAVSVPVALVAWVALTRVRPAPPDPPIQMGETMSEEAAARIVPDPSVMRSPAARILAAVLWCVPVVVAIRAAVGMIVGITADDGSVPTDALFDASVAASVAFFAQYGLVVNVAGAAIAAWLSVIGFLPGTAKYKKGS